MDAQGYVFIAVGFLALLTLSSMTGYVVYGAGEGISEYTQGVSRGTIEVDSCSGVYDVFAYGSTTFTFSSVNGEETRTVSDRCVSVGLEEFYCDGDVAKRALVPCDCNMGTCSNT